MEKKSLPSLDKMIESLVFVDGGEISFARAAEVCKVSVEEISAAAQLLASTHSDRGTVYVVSDVDISLRVGEECGDFIKEYSKKNFSEDVGPAALEVLALLLYRGPSTQAEIDLIRGVHSSYTLRALRVRGLIERVTENGRSAYVCTSETLAHLGVPSLDALPDRETIQKHIMQFEAREQSDL